MRNSAGVLTRGVQRTPHNKLLGTTTIKVHLTPMSKKNCNSTFVICVFNTIFTTNIHLRVCLTNANSMWPVVFTLPSPSFSLLLSPSLSSLLLLLCHICNSHFCLCLFPAFRIQCASQIPSLQLLPLCLSFRPFRQKILICFDCQTQNQKQNFQFEAPLAHAHAFIAQRTCLQFRKPSEIINSIFISPSNLILQMRS